MLLIRSPEVPSIQFLTLLVQSDTGDEKMESSADGDEDRIKEEQNKSDSDKMEEGCGKLRIAIQ